MSDQEQHPLLSANLEVDPYTLLELMPNASEADIKQAYFRMVRRHPPERDPQTFKQIRAAYEALKDPQNRLAVDMLRIEAWPEQAAGEKKAVRAKARKRSGEVLPDQVAASDVQRIARAFTDVSRRDFREDYKPVKKP
jgi:curved DNA-binding protein CbpA